MIHDDNRDYLQIDRIDMETTLKSNSYMERLLPVEDIKIAANQGNQSPSRKNKTVVS